jgi:hypothetical protein
VLKKCVDPGASIQIGIELEDDNTRGRTKNRETQSPKSESLSPRRSSFSLFGSSSNRRPSGASSLSPRGERARANTASDELPSPPLWSQLSAPSSSVHDKNSGSGGGGGGGGGSGNSEGKKASIETSHQKKGSKQGERSVEGSAVPGVSDMLVNNAEMPLNQKLTVLYDLRNLGAFGSEESKTARNLFAITKARILTGSHMQVEASASSSQAEDILKQARDMCQQIGSSATALLDRSEKMWKVSTDDVSLTFAAGPLGMGIFMHKEDNEICITKVAGQAIGVGAHVGDEIIKVGKGKRK